MARNSHQNTPNKRVTLQDVADQVGVCRMTVYNALHGQLKETWPKTRESAERIRRTAAEMGYRANAVARATRTGRFGNLVLLSSGAHGWHSQRLTRAMTLAADKRNYRLMVAEMDDHHFEKDDILPAVLRDWAADAILVNYISHRPARVRALVEQSTLPALWLNVRQPHNAVYFADYEAAVTAAEKLLELGHERIAYFASLSRSQRPHYSVADRRQGIFDTLAKQGLEMIECSLEHLRSFDDRERSTLAFDHARELLQTHRPTAGICYGTNHAYTVAYAAASLGWKVPEDLSLITFADSIPDDIGLPVAWMNQTMHLFCADAVDMAIKKIENPNAPLDSRSTQFDLFEGRTLAPPRPDA